MYHHCIFTYELNQINLKYFIFMFIFIFIAYLSSKIQRIRYHFVNYISNTMFTK